jgi:hypothetical protein
MQQTGTIEQIPVFVTQVVQFACQIKKLQGQPRILPAMLFFKATPPPQRDASSKRLLHSSLLIGALYSNSHFNRCSAACQTTGEPPER